MELSETSCNIRAVSSESLEAAPPKPRGRGPLKPQRSFERTPTRRHSWKKRSFEDQNHRLGKPWRNGKLTLANKSSSDACISQAHPMIKSILKSQTSIGTPKLHKKSVSGESDSDSIKNESNGSLNLPVILKRTSFQEPEDGSDSPRLPRPASSIHPPPPPVPQSRRTISRILSQVSVETPPFLRRSFQGALADLNDSDGSLDSRLQSPVSVPSTVPRYRRFLRKIHQY